MLTTLIALSSSGMQHLLDLCSVYATNHQLSYNATKSFSLRFKPNQFNPGTPEYRNTYKKTFLVTYL